MQKNNVELKEEFVEEYLKKHSVIPICVEPQEKLFPYCMCDNCYHSRYVGYLIKIGVATHSNIKSHYLSYDEYNKYLGKYKKFDPTTKLLIPLNEEETKEINYVLKKEVEIQDMLTKAKAMYCLHTIDIDFRCAEAPNNDSK
jgi:hypothetical protein